MTLRVVTAPAVEPISLAEAKAHLNITSAFTTDDDYILLLIKVAREYAENYTRRAFVQRTLELTRECFDFEIMLPSPPLVSVTSIIYTDSDGVETTVDSTTYQVDTYREPGLVKPAYQESWPTDVRSSNYNAVKIRYIAGYASGSPQDQTGLTENIPEVLKQWMKIRLGALYLHREPVITGTIISEFPRDFVDGLLDGLRVNLF